MKNYILTFLPCGIYFVSKLLRYWILKREDDNKSGFTDKIIFAALITTSILALPISILGFAIDNLFETRILRNQDAALRFVRKATLVEAMPPKARQMAVLNSNDNVSWSFPDWVTTELQKYGADAEDIGFYFTRDPNYDYSEDYYDN